MRQDTWDKLEEKFADLPILRAESVPIEEINRASGEVGLPFPDDYREFVHRYGGAVLGGNPIYGLRRADAIGGTWSVIEVNEEYREQEWPHVEDWVVISTDGRGNPFGIGPTGEVWRSDHDAGFERELIARDFEDFIRRKCLELA